MVDSSFVIQLLYCSTAAKPFSPEALRALLVLARARNTAAEVSGMMLHIDGSFLQALEGEPSVVAALFGRISADPRHVRVQLLRREDITSRSFGDWSMGFVDASGQGASLPGYRQTAGFADLLGDPAMITRVVTEFRGGRWRSLAA
jgi:Sensors of blue-light using FAD